MWVGAGTEELPAMEGGRSGPVIGAQSAKEGTDEGRWGIDARSVKFDSRAQSRHDIVTLFSMHWGSNQDEPKTFVIMMSVQMLWVLCVLLG